MSKPKHLFLIILLATIAVLLFVYFAAFKNLVIVQDNSWKRVLPKDYYINLRGKLATKGFRLSVVTIESDLLDEANLKNSFSKLDTGKLIVVSPVVTSAVVTLGIDLEDELKSSTVVGIGFSNSAKLFDAILVSNTTTGWESAAKKAVGANTKVAVLFDNEAINEAQVLYEGFGASSAVKINKEEYGKLFATEIEKQLETEKVEVVFCPHVDSLSELKLQSMTQKWVVDYRYSGVVPKDKLLGVVCPDLVSSLERFLKPSTFRLDEETEYLTYEYRKIK